ncbi:MAG TPA: DNA polymerase III subunit gamma/tau [Solirubrobacterales bacterium]|nr:DNA polymerase III subunit gamma/tau [Solirubrobacterales bacterium]
MAETSLYRRHRPQAFDEVVGQEHVVRTLRNAVEQDRVHHAYLFVGSRGTGKTSMAKILARCLNCERGGPTTQPCGECESCRAIAAGTSLDVIEMDAASNRSVDDIRELRERVGYVPAAGRWKVYIIDEAHMLTREAWNAFLKTLEEPPPNTVFVLATTEAHKVMPTIVDRCQRFDFQRPSAAQIAEVLERAAGSEGIEVEPGAISAIARSANGSFRDALGTLDQLVAYGGSPVKTDDVLAVLGVADAELIFGAADAVADGDGRAVLETVERLARSGRESSQFIRDLIAHLRQLLVIRTAGTVPDAFTVTPAQDERLREQAERIGDIAAVRAIDALSAAQSAIREWGDDPRAALELALLKAARPDVDPSREALAQRIERLERGASGPIRVTEERQDAPGAGTEAERAAPAQSEEAADAETPKADAGGGAAIRAAATSGAATAEAIDLERVAGLWPAVLDQVRQSGSELLSAVFAAARPLAVDAERAVLEVGFPPSAAFNKRKAEAEGNRERLTEAVRMIVGERLRPVYVLLDGEDAGAANGAEPAMGEDELIERIKAEFDAEEFEPEEDSA